MLLWLFPLLISLPHAQGRRDPCSGAFPEINRTIRFNVSNETHCVFVPPNDDNVLKNHQPERGVLARVFSLNITAARQQCAKFDAGLVQLRTGAMFEVARKKIKYELLGIDNYENPGRDGPFIPIGMVILKIVNWTMGSNETYAYTVKWDNGDVVTMTAIMDLWFYADGTMAFWTAAYGVYVGRPVIMSISGLFSTTNGTTFTTFYDGGGVMVCHQEPLGTARSTPLPLHSTTTSSASLPVVLPSSVLSLALGIVIYDWTNGQ